MQNLLNAKDALVHKRVFVQKFFTDSDSINRINLIDVEDFANCVTEIVGENRFEYAALELCGPENLSVSDMISALEEVLGGKIGFKHISDDELKKSMSAKNASDYSIDTLLRMFHHYNEGDFCGSDFVVSAILKRHPHTFVDFLKRELL